MTLDLSTPSRPNAKIDGPRHVLAAFGYSVDGFRRLLQETAFRHELFAGLVIFCSFVIANVDAIHYLAQVALMLMLLAVEALNTAVELIVDRASPEFSVFAKQAKDLGSFAVFCMLSMNALFAIYALCLSA